MEDDDKNFTPDNAQTIASQSSRQVRPAVIIRRRTRPDTTLHRRSMSLPDVDGLVQVNANTARSSPSSNRLLSQDVQLLPLQSTDSSEQTTESGLIVEDEVKSPMPPNAPVSSNAPSPAAALAILTRRTSTRSKGSPILSSAANISPAVASPLNAASTAMTSTLDQLSINTMDSAMTSSMASLAAQAAQEGVLPFEVAYAREGIDIATVPPADLARQLYFGGYRRRDVTKFLTKRVPGRDAILESYMNFYDFNNMTIVDAIRRFTSTFSLVGESQQIERILTAFAKRYHATNPGKFASHDVVSVLVNAVVLLNTDLHNKNNTNKMRRRDFVANSIRVIASLPESNSQSVSEILLRETYAAIKQKPIRLPIEEQENSIETQSSITFRSIPLSASSTVTSTMAGSIRSRLSLFRNMSLRRSASPSASVNMMDTTMRQTRSSNSVTAPLKEGQNVLVYEGSLLRKQVTERYDKKALRRIWRPFFATLCGSQLLFYKPIHDVSRQQNNKNLESLTLCHALADFVPAYKDREHVFSVQLANGALFLFQTDSAPSAAHWIACINHQAALHSAQPLPAPVSSDADFLAPAMPMHVSPHPPSTQLNLVERRAAQLNEELVQHIAARAIDYEPWLQVQHSGHHASEASARKARFWEQKMQFLNRETHKYAMYRDQLRLGLPRLSDSDKLAANSNISVQ